MSELVILTKKWGRNFTGATLATQRLTEEWRRSFRKITVYTLEIGQYTSYSEIFVHRAKSKKHLEKMLKEHRKIVPQKLFGYSDDHLGYLLGKAKIPYLHTYHGNWPDARWINKEFFFKSFYFIPQYRRTIRLAEKVVNVSEYMERFTKKYNPNSTVIRNGIDFKQCEINQIMPKTFVMVGNIDARKYKKAIELAKKTEKIDNTLRIHIYGEGIDSNIEQQLRGCSNVLLQGQKTEIPYTAYCGLISTSTIENLSISICEAILSGIPAFAFRVGGLSEVIIEGRTGFEFARGDVDSMAKSLVQYANSGEKMNIECKRLESFDWEIAVQKYLDLFAKLEMKTG